MAQYILSSVLSKVIPAPTVILKTVPAVSLTTSAVVEMPSCRKYRKPHPVPEKVGVNPYKGQALQEWWDWDGKGPYKYRHHHYPNNITCRDVQRRRIFKKFHSEREKLNFVVRSDLLPMELREKAWREKHFEIPTS